MFSEAINRLFVLITIVPTGVIVGVLLLDHLPFFISEQLDRLVHRLEPWVLVDLFYRKTLLWVDFKQASEHLTGFLRDVFLE